MTSEWMKVMLEEISRKKAEAAQSRVEEQTRCDEQKRGGEQSGGEQSGGEEPIAREADTAL